MAPLPPNNTDVYFVDYEGSMGERTFQVRAVGGSDEAAVVVQIRNFIETLRPALYTSTVFTGCRKRDVGTNVSYPLSWTPIAGTAAGTLAQADYPRYIDFVGRSRDGRRVKITLFGTNLAISADYRLTEGENASILAAVQFLTSGANSFVTISGMSPLWERYANQGFNAYYQQEQRNNL